MTELSIISGKSGRAASRSLSTNKRSMQVMLNYSELNVQWLVLPGGNQGSVRFEQSCLVAGITYQ